MIELEGMRLLGYLLMWVAAIMASVLLVYLWYLETGDSFAEAMRE